MSFVVDVTRGIFVPRGSWIVSRPVYLPQVFYEQPTFDRTGHKELKKYTPPLPPITYIETLRLLLIPMRGG